MRSLNDLKIQIYADGADKAGILDLYAKPYIKGLTTNPSLMKKAGIKDYEAFARDILQTVTAKPISLEVFLRRIFRDEAAGAQDRRLGQKRLRQDSHHQLARRIVAAVDPRTGRPARAAQRHRDPHGRAGARRRRGAQSRGPVGRLRFCRPHRRHRRRSHAAHARVRAVLAGHPKAELLWASVREVLNILQAEACGCAIVTVPHDILAKAAKMLGTDLTALSLDTVKMFANDAAAVGYTRQTQFLLP
jgi:transaldolase